MNHANAYIPTMEKVVFDVLQRDKASRSLSGASVDGASVDGSVDLFAIEDLKPAEWDYALPTLASGSSNFGKVARSSREFATRWHDVTKMHLGRMDNIIIAGGSVSACLLGSTRGLGDIDVFLYGLTPEQATARVNGLIRELIEDYRRVCREEMDAHEREQDRTRGGSARAATTAATKSREEPQFDFKYIRNKGCVTLIFDDKIIWQIILRIYHNKSEVLHGFDLGSSAVGFDGERVYLTSAARFAYEYSCNIIDTTHRSTTYEHRLMKYFARGFDIVMPNFNIAALRDVNAKYNMKDVCEMPHWVFSYSEVQGNKIKVDRFLRPDESRASDYQIDRLTEYEIFYINLHSLVWDKTDYYFFTDRVDDVMGGDGRASEGATAHPFLSRRKIIDYYDELVKKVGRRGGSLDIRLLRRYVRGASDILRVLIGRDEDNAQFVAALARGIQEEKVRVLAAADALLAREFPLEWKTENPGTQITASFNPIIEDMQLWYGAAYYTGEPCVGRCLAMVAPILDEKKKASMLAGVTTDASDEDDD